jgi:hypothetical protein
MSKKEFKVPNARFLVAMEDSQLRVSIVGDITDIMFTFLYAMDEAPQIASILKTVVEASKDPELLKLMKKFKKGSK